jgi:Fur family transcriptional regulator, ferric uptake regulator
MPSLTREEARRRVHDAGLRATAPRVAVLQLLTESARPLSHSEVVDALGNGDWDQATLYRNLLKLVDADLAHVASRVGGITRYEVRSEDDDPHLHPHFACRDCGSVECLTGAELTPPRDPAWREALLDAELQVVGRCPSCRGRRSGARGARGGPSSRRRTGSRG